MSKVKALLEAVSDISSDARIKVYVTHQGDVAHLANPGCYYARGKNIPAGGSAVVFTESFLDEIIDFLCPQCQNAIAVGCISPDSYNLVTVSLALALLEKYKKHIDFLAMPMSDKLDAYKRLYDPNFEEVYKYKDKLKMSILTSSTGIIHLSTPPHISVRTICAPLGRFDAAKPIYEAACLSVEQRCKDLPETLLVKELEEARETVPKFLRRIKKKTKKSEGVTEPGQDQRTIVAFATAQPGKTGALMRVYGSATWADNVPVPVFLELVPYCEAWAVQTTDDREILETARTLFEDKGIYTDIRSALKAATQLK